jgi:hypothetical protein
VNYACQPAGYANSAQIAEMMAPNTQLPGTKKIVESVPIGDNFSVVADFA